MVTPVAHQGRSDLLCYAGHHNAIGTWAQTMSYKHCVCKHALSKAHLAAGGAPIAVGVHDALGLIVVVALDNGLADAGARIVSELGRVCRGGERIVGAGPDLLRQQVRLAAGEATVTCAAFACLQYNDRELLISNRMLMSMHGEPESRQG